MKMKHHKRNNNNKANKGYDKNKKGFINKNEFLEDINYFEGKKEGIIKSNLFSDEAKNIVDNFIFMKNEEDFEERKGKKVLLKKLSYNQIRKFYDEVINIKEQLENKKGQVDDEKAFKMILPYFKMLKARAYYAYKRNNINTNFKTFIENNVDYVDNENKFKIFCTFFEAVVAYSKEKKFEKDDDKDKK